MQKNGKVRAVLSFLSIALLNLGAATSAMMQNVLTVVQAEYAEVSSTSLYQLITLPSLICLFASLIIGVFIGRKVSYKFVVAAGTVLYLIGGVGPMFGHFSFGALLGLRCIFGVGLGAMSFGNAIIMANYIGNEQAKFLSLSTLVYNLMFMAISSVEGWLGSVSYRATYYIYILGVIVLLFILLFFEEPASTKENMEAAKAGAKREKTKLNIPPLAVFWAFMGFVLLVWKFPYTLQVSLFTAERGIANPTVLAGLLMSVYQAGGFVGCLIYPTLNKKFSRWTFPFALLLVALDVVLVMGTHSIPLYYISYFIGGTGFTMTGLIRMNYVGSVTEPGSMGFANSMITAFVFGAMYVSPYWIILMNNVFNGIAGTQSEVANWWSCAIGYGLCALIMIIKDPRPKQYKEIMEAESNGAEVNIEEAAA